METLVVTRQLSAPNAFDLESVSTISEEQLQFDAPSPQAMPSQKEANWLLVGFVLAALIVYYVLSKSSGRALEVEADRDIKFTDADRHRDGYRVSDTLQMASENRQSTFAGLYDELGIDETKLPPRQRKELEQLKASFQAVPALKQPLTLDQIRQIIADERAEEATRQMT